MIWAIITIAIVIMLALSGVVLIALFGATVWRDTPND